MMNKRLAEIAERVAKATPGPWEIAGCDGQLIGVNGPNGFNHDLGPIHGQLQVHGMNDADFIASAREDVPWLLAEIERLNQIAVQSKAFIDAIDDGMGCGDNLMCIEEYPCDECPVVKLRELLSERRAMVSEV